MDTAILEINDMPVGYVRIAENAKDKLSGLSLTEEEQAGYLLALPSCRTVHTLFMRFPVDIVYCDESGNVLEVHRKVEPWHFDRCACEGSTAIEALAGTFLKNVHVGDVIRYNQAEDIC